MGLLDPEELSSIRNQSISSAIFGQLEKMILSGEWQPGERINESQLAASLGVSRAPIREACRQLEKYGMVEVKVGRGTFVCAVKLEEALELYDIRTALEVLACERAAQESSEEDFLKLEKYIATMEECAHQNDVQCYLKVNLDFHHEIFKMSGNTSLLALLETITKKLTLFRASVLSQPGELFNSLDEHKKIIAAIRAKDVALATKIIKSHVTKGKNALIAGRKETE